MWSRVTNLTAAAISSREKLITYDTPNGAGATTYTEADTLSAAGGATDSGWSKQYRDRPSFAARGELLHGGVWRVAQTTRSNMYIQRDNTFPFSCDNNPGNVCHRWPTTSTGGPVTLLYAWDTNLDPIVGDMVGDIHFVLGKFEALSGGSPNLNPTVPDNEDIWFHAYHDPNDRAFARATGIARTAFPQYYYYGFARFNTASALHDPHRALVCHEFGHILGLNHVTFTAPNNVVIQGSKATCHGAEFDEPYIDDQQALSKIYSTPLAAGP